MVGVQDEQLVERLDLDRVKVIRLGREAKGHAQEVLYQGQGVVGIQERLPDALLVGIGRDRGQLCHQANGRHLNLLSVKRVEAVLVERGQCRDSRGQHGHRVRVSGEAPEEAAQVLMQQCVAADPSIEVGQLVGARKLAVDKEVGGLQERGVLGELLDRVAAVAKDSGVTVDVGNRRTAGSGIDEAGVEGDSTGLLQQFGYVESVASLC